MNRSQRCPEAIECLLAKCRTATVTDADRPKPVVRIASWHARQRTLGLAFDISQLRFVRSVNGLCRERFVSLTTGIRRRTATKSSCVSFAAFRTNGACSRSTAEPCARTACACTTGPAPALPPFASRAPAGASSTGRCTRQHLRLSRRLSHRQRQRLRHRRRLPLNHRPLRRPAPALAPRPSLPPAGKVAGLIGASASIFTLT